MPVYETSYRRWEGRFHRRVFRWWPMVRRGVPLLLKSKVLIALLVIFLLFTMGSQAVNLFLLQQGLALMTGMMAKQYLDAIMPFTVVMLIFSGARLISGDLRANAFQLYGARPMTWLDYFKGKFGIVAVLVAFTTLLPGLAFYWFGIGAQMAVPPWERLLASTLAVTAYAAVIITVFGLLILLLSSLTKSALWAGVSWLVLYYFGHLLSQLLAGGLGVTWPHYLSLKRLVEHAGVRIFEWCRVTDYEWLDLETRYLQPLAFNRIDGFSAFTTGLGRNPPALEEIARHYAEQYPEQLAEVARRTDLHMPGGLDALTRLVPGLPQEAGTLFQRLMESSGEGLLAGLRDHPHFLRFAVAERYAVQQYGAEAYYNMDWQITALVLGGLVLVTLVVTLLRLRRAVLER